MEGSNAQNARRTGPGFGLGVTQLSCPRCCYGGTLGGGDGAELREGRELWVSKQLLS